MRMVQNGQTFLSKIPAEVCAEKVIPRKDDIAQLYKNSLLLFMLTPLSKL